MKELDALHPFDFSPEKINLIIKILLQICVNESNSFFLVWSNLLKYM